MHRTKIAMLALVLGTISITSHSHNFIFDLFGVLVHIPVSEKIKQTGIIDPLTHFLWEQKPITKIKANFFDMLCSVPAMTETDLTTESAHKRTIQGDAMPAIMYEWQAGLIGYRDALQEINNHIDQANYSKCEKRIFRNGTMLAFDLETRKQSYRLMEEGVALVKRLHAEVDEHGNRKHKLYILSNMDKDMIDHLTTSYPALFSIFAGIVYSAENGSLKPDEAIYRAFLERFQLKAEESTMIDDQNENVEGAIALGMQGILCDSHARVSAVLEEKGVLSRSEWAFAQWKQLLF